MESNSLEAINLMTQQCLQGESSDLVKSILDLAAHAQAITWKHIFTEANHVADSSAKFGLSNLNTSCFF